MLVMIVFFFYFLLRMHHYFVVICVTKRHRDINVGAPNIHTQVSAVQSVSAVSVVFVSDGFTNTNVV